VERFTCDWIFKIVVVLCDGQVVCGCADPYAERPLGDLGDRSLSEIWHSQRAREIRKGLNAGYSPFCRPCGLKRPLAPNEHPLPGPLEGPALPRLFLEPTVACNLSCFQAVCARESPLRSSRRRPHFPLAEFRELIDASGAGLGRIDFFNYGEPFAHPQAVDMLEYVKSRFPHIYLYVSTNGLLLDRERISRLVRAGVDEITFSVDGADQRTYARYRCGGRLKKALWAMRQLVLERDRTGREVPFINWRCILFRWNDSRFHMWRLKRLARRIGVDRLVWEITDHPADAKSRRYQVGTPAWRRIFHEIWDSSQIGNALAEKRFRAEIGPAVDVLAASAGVPSRLRVRLRNRGGARWLSQTFSGRRHVRLGAQLHDGQRRLLELNYARRALAGPVAAGETVELEIHLPGLAAGDYWLKLDLAWEGIAWFEAGGSPVAWVALRVSA